MPYKGDVDELDEKLLGVVDMLKLDGTVWPREMSEYLEKFPLTARQQRQLHGVATITLRQMWPRTPQNKLDPAIHHAFRDPVLKSIACLVMFKKGEFYHTSLLNLKQAISDISRNYALIFKNDPPQSVMSILEYYENEIVPLLDKILEIYKRERTPDLTSGHEHFAPLPESW